MSNSRQHRWLLLVLGGLALIAGCTTAAPTPTAVPTTPIAIGGSDAVYPLMKALTTEFVKTHPRTEFRYAPESETLGGLTGLGDGSLTIALASREVTAEEQAKYKIRPYSLAKDGLAFAVSAPIELTALTKQQIMDIYSGKVTNWKEVGGPDATIVAFTRPAKTSPTQLLGKALWGSDFTMAPTVTEMFTPKNMSDALPNTPNAIGYISMADVLYLKLPLKMISIDGVAPTADNLTSGKYLLFRPFLVVAKEEPDASVKEFINFVQSEAGVKIIQAMGYVPGK